MGGELKGLSKLTSDVRDELIYELKEKAATLGANAVVGLRWGEEDLLMLQRRRLIGEVVQSRRRPLQALSWLKARTSTFTFKLRLC